jgi:protein-arginine kinase activator protein McsA
MFNFNKDFLAGFISGAVIGATGYKLYEENAGDLGRLVKNAGKTVTGKVSIATNGKPTLEELIMQKENLEDLIAEQELETNKD